jgi:hypothetical protein
MNRILIRCVIRQVRSGHVRSEALRVGLKTTDRVEGRERRRQSAKELQRSERRGTRK